jgi:hypothetical protein
MFLLLLRYTVYVLPESEIDATSVNNFKNRLNNHWKNIEIKFVPDFTDRKRVLVEMIM